VPRLAFALIVVVIIGCGKPAAQAGYPQLPDDDGPVDPRPPVANTAPVVATTPQLFEPGGAACMPPGIYDVTFDLSAAQLTVVGQAEEFCRSMLEELPATMLTQMKLAIEAGQLAVYWPSRQTVVATTPCTFEIKSPPVFATITFADGAGTGTAEYAIGTPNHPDERCGAKGAKLTLVRSSS
jgi:hypothetical protein